jgi:predicted nucleic-acid-binding Zn-ribbon protein
MGERDSDGKTVERWKTRIKCPKCCNVDIAPYHIPMPGTYEYRQCPVCGHEWIEGDK